MRASGAECNDVNSVTDRLDQFELNIFEIEENEVEGTFRHFETKGLPIHTAAEFLDAL